MKFWADKLKPVSGASPLVGYVNLFFILLLIFILSSRFVTMMGIRSKSVSLLPTMKSANIALANKIIVSVTRKETQVLKEASKPAVGGKETAPVRVVSYEYSFNGEVVQDAEALRKRLGEELLLYSYVGTEKNRRPDEVMIVLMASKDIPYEKLIDFYKLCREFGVPLFLAVNDGTADQLPSQLQGGLE